MSGTVSRGGEGSRRDDAVTAAAPGRARPSPSAVPVEPRRHGRRRLVAAVAVGMLAAAAGGALGVEAYRPGSSSGGGQGAQAPATKPVVREDLSSQTPVTATLGYAGSYTVRGRGGGTLTSLPSSGQVIGQGQVLYRVDNGIPVVLLYGPVPAWRTLDAGLTGADVLQLNHDLVALGYASSSQISAQGWDYFSWQTQEAVQRMESALGVSSPPGSLPLGLVVFEPQAIRVTGVLGILGGPASGPVLASTSDQHLVTIPLSTSQESQVAVGNAVTVTLPDGASTAGKVSSVGTVASGTGSNATISVTVTLAHPSAAGTLDQAPVTVYITTASVTNALVVPVGALLAQSSGRYAVEVIGARGTRRLVAVTLGIFSDNSGVVQVTGALTPGQQVVVPAT